jgi:ankyrin repeat protein
LSGAGVGIVTHLLAAGVDVRLVDGGRKGSAASVAATHCTADVVAALLAAGVSANAAGCYGDTPLVAACRRQDADVVDALLSAGADVKATGAQKEADTPLRLAVDANSERMDSVACRMLAAGAPPNVRGARGVSLLLRACTDRRRDLALALLDAGADGASPDDPSKDGTPLQQACENGLDDVALRLIAGGADVNAYGRGEAPPLVAALAASCADGVLHALLAAGAKTSPWLRDGARTPLSLACLHGREAFALRLIEAGVCKSDMDAVADDGDTALTNACELGMTDVALALLARGARYTTRDRSRDSYTARDIADDNGMDAVVAAIDARAAADEAAARRAEDAEAAAAAAAAALARRGRIVTCWRTETKPVSRRNWMW